MIKAKNCALPWWEVACATRAGRPLAPPWTVREPRTPAAERSGVRGAGGRAGKGGGLFLLLCSLSFPEGSRGSCKFTFRTKYTFQRARLSLRAKQTALPGARCARLPWSRGFAARPAEACGFLPSL